MDHHLFTSLVTLLFISCVVLGIAKWIKQPYTIILVLAGLILAIFKVAPPVHISHNITFMIILPPLLFHGAMHMDLSELKENWKTIGMLAIPGVVCSTILIGAVLHYFVGLTWSAALLFGALITPTDPISVLAILKKVGAPKRLRTILEGESLFNDGTGVVVFSIILGIVSGHEHFEIGHTFAEFLKVAFGGTFIGLIVGLVFYKMLKTVNDHLQEVAMTIVMAFGTPLLAEYFHFSGIIAVVVAGLIIGNYGKVYSMSEKTCGSLDSFWEVIDFVIISILFLVIGIELQVIKADNFSSLIPPICWTIFAVLLSRAVVVYPVVLIKNFISKNDIPFNWSHVLFWGGLKGSISIALVVGLPASVQNRELYLTLAFAVVLFTLIVQGLTMKPLIKSLKLTDN